MVDRALNVLFCTVVTMLVMNMLAEEGYIQKESKADEELYQRHRAVIKQKGYLR